MMRAHYAKFLFQPRFFMLDVAVGRVPPGPNYHEMKNLCLPTLLFFLSAFLSACNPMGGSIQSNQPNAVVNSTPHAQTLEEGEALENQMAKEAEEKAKQDRDPANQVRTEQD